MTVVYPEGVRARGNESLLFVEVLADPGAPTALELADAINISCFVNAFAVNGEQASEEDRRLCSEQIFESPGDVTVSIDPVQYVYYPQSAPANPLNIAYDTMKNGVTGYMVDRRGLNSRTVAIAVAQKVDVYPVTLGEQFRLAIDPGDNAGKLRIVQKPFVTGPVEYDAVIA